MPLRVRSTPAMFQRNVASLTPLIDEVQREAFLNWRSGLEERFRPEQLQVPIGEVELGVL